MQVPRARHPLHALAGGIAVLNVREDDLLGLDLGNQGTGSALAIAFAIVRSSRSWFSIVNS